MGKKRGAPEKASVRKILQVIPGTGGLLSAIATTLNVHYRTGIDPVREADGKKWSELQKEII